MMPEFFVGGVATATIFEGENLVAVARTLINNSLDIRVQQEAIRGGKHAGLLGFYSHSPTIDVTIEDALFNLDYIRMNMGTNFKIGTDYLSCDVVTCVEDGVIVVPNEPVGFYNMTKLGWLEDNSVVVFDGRIARDSRFVNGKSYAIRYYYNVPSAREIKIPAHIIPSVVTVVFDMGLFFTNDTIQNVKQVGNIQITVPRLQLSGAQKIEMSMTGATTTGFTGTAMLYDMNNCDGGHYLKMTENIQYEVLAKLLDIDGLKLSDLDGMTVREMDYKLVDEIEKTLGTTLQEEDKIKIQVIKG